MKVIFLDIDGVMNSVVFYKQRHKKRWLKPITYWWLIRKFIRKLFRIKPKAYSLANYKTPSYRYEYSYQFKRLKDETCSEKWSWLSNWCNETGVKICISSTWKHHFGNKENLLNSDRWKMALTDLGFKSGTFVGITGDRRSLRGDEIKDWLDLHPEVEDYAILDDDSDMLKEQMKKFHHCDGWFGLSPNHLYRIDRQFNKGSNYSRLTESL